MPQFLWRIEVRTSYNAGGHTGICMVTNIGSKSTEFYGLGPTLVLEKI